MFDDSDRPPEPDAPSQPKGEPEPDPAQARFQRCQWHATDGDRKYCSNRDVLPYAGKNGFDPLAWCPDCTLYKLRRTPKKRPRSEVDDDSY